MDGLKAIVYAAKGSLDNSYGDDGNVAAVAMAATMRSQDTVPSLPAMSVTFHRAFDTCSDPAVPCLMALRRLGVDRILTSGRAPSAWEGRHVLRDLVQAEAALGSGGNDGSCVMAGAGIHVGNVAELLRFTGVSQVHAGSALAEDHPRVASARGPCMGPASAGREHLIRLTSAAKVKDILEVIAAAHERSS